MWGLVSAWVLNSCLVSTATVDMCDGPGMLMGVETGKKGLFLCVCAKYISGVNAIVVLLELVPV